MCDVRRCLFLDVNQGRAENADADAVGVHGDIAIADDRADRQVFDRAGAFGCPHTFGKTTMLHGASPS